MMKFVIIATLSFIAVVSAAPGYLHGHGALLGGYGGLSHAAPSLAYGHSYSAPLLSYAAPAIGHASYAAPAHYSASSFGHAAYPAHIGSAYSAPLLSYGGLHHHHGAVLAHGW